jgi:cellulose biosynthesis protein BcsQ
MLQYTVYAEAGGTGKTTLAGNLAVAHARAGLDVLVIPLDVQDADLSHMFDVDADRSSRTEDTLVHHLVGQPQGPFEELVETREGVDIIPEDDLLGSLHALFSEHDLPAGCEPIAAADIERGWKQLHRVLAENDVAENYDVVICDPPATEGMAVYNALVATQTLVLAVEPTPKGRESVAGMHRLINGLSAKLQTQIGVAGAVPVRFRGTNLHEQTLAELSYSTLTCIRERSSLFDGAWDAQCSAFQFVREERSRVRDYERETLAKLDKAARQIEHAANLEPPHPPDPGAPSTEQNPLVPASGSQSQQASPDERGEVSQ